MSQLTNSVIYAIIVEQIVAVSYSTKFWLLYCFLGCNLIGLFIMIFIAFAETGVLVIRFL